MWLFAYVLGLGMTFANLLLPHGNHQTAMLWLALAGIARLWGKLDEVIRRLGAEGR